MTIHNCLKHGVQVPILRGYENFACPECEKEAAADAARNTYGKPQARPIQPEEEAVLRAADVWRLTFGTNAEEHRVSIAALEEAVDAYRALQPKAVRPEEVQPGTRFRFRDDPTKTVWTLVHLVGGSHPEDNAYVVKIMAKRGGQIVEFTEESRIIPLSDQE